MKSEKFQVKSPILGFDNVSEAEFTEVDDGALGFLFLQKQNQVFGELLLINPYKVREYSFEVPAAIQTLLDITKNSKVKVFCVFVRDEKESILINFLAPIILNDDNKTLAQVVLNAKEYPTFGVAEPIKNYIKE